MDIRKFAALVMTGLMAASLAACSDIDDEEDYGKSSKRSRIRVTTTESKLTEDEDDTDSEDETASAEEKNKLPEDASRAWTICDASGKETDKAFVLYKDMSYAITEKDDLSGGSVNPPGTPDPEGYITDLPITIVYDDKQVMIHDYVNTMYDDKTVYDCYESILGCTDACVDFRVKTEKGGDVYMELTTQYKKRANLWLSSEKDEEGHFINYRSLGTYFDSYADPVVCLGSFAAGTEINLRVTILSTNGRYTGQNEYIMVKKDGYNICELDSKRLKEISDDT